MDGILNVHKPSGPTSHDIVNRIRKITGTRRVGHAGTLDPLASGVLVVFVGKATRMIEYMNAEPKVYTAGLLLGRSTDTADITGHTLEERCIESVKLADLQGAVVRFRGTIEQVPPMYSAIKKEGKPLYKLAYKGESVERLARRVTIYSLEVQEFSAGEQASAILRVSCSSGTYIRTLCEDIGKAVGVPACMSSLVRNAVGSFKLDSARTPDELDCLAADGLLNTTMLPVSNALTDLPVMQCDAGQASALSRGNVVAYTGDLAAGILLSLTTQEGTLLGVGVVLKEGGRTIVKPEKILV